jgi:hypothetical protein
MLGTSNEGIMDRLYRPIERLESAQTIRLLNPDDGTPFVRVKMKAESDRHPDFQVDRFVWFCVVRGEEDQGVKLFMMPKSLHHIVIGQILAMPVQPKLTWKQKFFRRCANLWVTRRVGLSKWLMNRVPQPTNCLDLLVGYDFIVRREFKGKTAQNRRGFPTYERSGFLPESKLAGTPTQLAEWQQQMKTMDPQVENLTLI